MLAVAVLSASTGVSGQSAGRKVLTSATSLTCTFSLLATGTWTKGEPQAEVKPAKLTLEFNEIDTQDGTADAGGGYGSRHVVARLSGDNLHFLQLASEGPVYFTTVFGRESRPGKLLAVHTRHEWTVAQLPGYTSRPEQYYGECEPKTAP